MKLGSPGHGGEPTIDRAGETQRLSRERHRADHGPPQAGQEQGRPAERQAEKANQGGSGHGQPGEQRAAQSVLRAEDPPFRAVVFRCHLDPPSRPEAAVDLQVPVAPSPIRHDQVLPRRDGFLETLEQHFFL